MLQKPWNISPDVLDCRDAGVVTFISGVMTDDFRSRLLGPENFAVRRRLAELMAKHSQLHPGDLEALSPERRRALAESIIRAEIAELTPAPVQTAPVPGEPDSGSVPSAPTSSPAPGSELGLVRQRRFVKPTRRERESAEVAFGAGKADLPDS